MQRSYPNLNLIAYKAKRILIGNRWFRRNFDVPLAYRDRLQYYISLDLEVFPQVWDDIHTGFDLEQPDRGNRDAEENELTMEYTTVLLEPQTGMYLVFFGNSFAYMVRDANHLFLRDLMGRNMAGQKEAKDRY